MVLWKVSRVVWLNYALYDLICPVNLSIFWSFGFVLGIIVVIQVCRGLFLSFHYRSGGFDSVVRFCRNVTFAELVRFFHSSGVRILFFCLYIHVFRGFTYMRFFLHPVWGSGLALFFLFVIVSFLGYRLPWAQMRFWAVTVITNLVTALPYIGENIVLYLWGRFSVSVYTLERFFSFHYLLPFVSLVLIGVHIFSLHLVHSQRPLQFKGEGLKFWGFFLWKDIVVFLFLIFWLVGMVYFFPFFFLESEMFLNNNPLSAPEHIVPEWYFLPFYAVLRAVPNKLGGVILIVGVFVFVYLFRFGRSFSVARKVWVLYRVSLLFFWVILFWVGGLPVLFPYDVVGIILVFLIFLFFILGFII